MEPWGRLRGRFFNGSTLFTSRCCGDRDSDSEDPGILPLSEKRSRYFESPEVTEPLASRVVDEPTTDTGVTAVCDNDRVLDNGSVMVFDNVDKTLIVDVLISDTDKDTAVATGPGAAV